MQEVQGDQDRLPRFGIMWRLSKARGEEGEEEGEGGEVGGTRLLVSSHRMEVPMEPTRGERMGMQLRLGPECF